MQLIENELESFVHYRNPKEGEYWYSHQGIIRILSIQPNDIIPDEICIDFSIIQSKPYPHGIGNPNTISFMTLSPRIFHRYWKPVIKDEV